MFFKLPSLLSSFSRTVLYRG